MSKNEYLLGINCGIHSKEFFEILLNDETLQTNQNDILLLYPKVRISNFCLFALRVFLRFCNMKGHYNKISDNNESFEKKFIEPF